MEKTKYYTSDNISQISESILNEISNKISNKIRIKEILEKNINIKNSILLVLDMQNYFLNELSHAYIPSASAIIQNIIKLIEKFRKMGSFVIFTKHTNNIKNSGLMAEWWRDSIPENNFLSQITNEFDISNSIIINKHQYDAFYQTDLEIILRNMSAQTLIVTGVMTHLCCDTTIRSAFVRSFGSVFPIDATATYNLDLHKASILNLSHGFTIPVLTDQILNLNI